MVDIRRLRLGLVGAASLALVAGCAQLSDSDRSLLEAAVQNADQAAAAAERAATAAQNAQATAQQALQRSDANQRAISELNQKIDNMARMGDFGRAKP